MLSSVWMTKSKQQNKHAVCDGSDVLYFCQVVFLSYVFRQQDIREYVQMGEISRGACSRRTPGYSNDFYRCRQPDLQQWLVCSKRGKWGPVLTHLPSGAKSARSSQQQRGRCTLDRILQVLTQPLPCMGLYASFYLKPTNIPCL